MRVTRATYDDLAEIADSAQHWTDPMPSASTWWVLDGDAAHGYAGAEIRGTTLHLTRCYVSTDYRGQGAQRALIRARLRWGKRLGATVAETYTWARNVPSIRSLIRCGFLLVDSTWDGEWTWLVWRRAL